MVTRQEAEEYVAFVEEFQQNTTRSMNIRIAIAQNMVMAIQLLKENQHDLRGIELLSRCVKNERWFLRLIKKGLSNAQIRLLEATAWIKQNAKDKELKKRAERLVEIVDLFNSNMNSIEARLALEEQLLKSKDKASYDAFIQQWENETKLNRKFLGKIIDTSDVASYFKGMKVIFKEKLLPPAAAGVTVAGILYTTLKNVTPEITFTGLLLSAFCFTLGTIVTQLSDVAKKVEQINTDALAKLK